MRCPRCEGFTVDLKDGKKLCLSCLLSDLEKIPEEELRELLLKKKEQLRREIN